MVSTMLIHVNLPKVLNIYQFIHFYLILSMSPMNCVLLSLFSGGGNLGREGKSFFQVCRVHKQ